MIQNQLSAFTDEKYPPETALQQAIDKITLLKYDLKHAASLIDIESVNVMLSATIPIYTHQQNKGL